MTRKWGRKVAKNNQRKASTSGRLSVEEVRVLMRKSGSFTKKQIDELTEKSLSNMPRVELSGIKPLSGPRGIRVKGPARNEVVRIYVGTDVEIDEKKGICWWRGPGCRHGRFWCKANHVSYKLLKAAKTAIDCRFGNPLWEIFIWEK
jgi:hypothetical protein